MQVKVKDGTVHIPAHVWKNAHLSQNGNYEIEVVNEQIIITSQLKAEGKNHRKSVRELAFVGMWADREDMTDSQDWLRQPFRPIIIGATKLPSIIFWPLWIKSTPV